MNHNFCLNVHAFFGTLTAPLTILVPSAFRTLFGCVYRPQGEHFGCVGGYVGTGPGVGGGGGVVVGGGVVGGGPQPKTTTTICEGRIGEFQASSNQNCEIA